MSAKNVGEPSDPLDRYMTPQWCVDEMVKHVLPIYDTPKRILEPGAGGGVFVNSLRQTYPDSYIAAIDIDPLSGPWEHADDSYGGDFLETAFSPFDLSVGNPPFSFAEAFARECLRLGPNLVFLLRLAFYASEERTSFFEQFPPAFVFSMPNRPKFLRRKKHGDSADYGFFCWAEGYEGPTILERMPPVPLEIRKLSEQ